MALNILNGKVNAAACKEWNTITEEVIQKPEKSDWKTPTSIQLNEFQNLLLINEIDTSQEARLNTEDDEFNRVLGGGLVPGSLTLLGGEPGIGKSTLLLQISLKLPYKTLYVSGEESQKQIKMRAERIDPSSAITVIFLPKLKHKISLSKLKH